MSSDALVKCVAYKLKYHMNVIQREDGFSPSGNCFKYEKPVVYPLPPGLLYLQEGDYSQKKRLSSCSSLENKDSVLSRRKQRYPNIPYYSPALVDKRRKERVVKIASKILVALGCYDGSGLQQTNRHKLLPRIQKKNSNLLNIHQRMQHFYEVSNGEEESYSEKESELIEQREIIDLTQQSANNAEGNRNSDSPISENGKSCSGAHFNYEEEIINATSRIFTEKHIKLHTEGAVSTYKKKTSDRLLPPQINNIQPEPYDVLVENSTQTDFTESVDQNTHQQAVHNEITSGPVTNYKIMVKTGNKLGASTRAQVNIVLYGDRGRTKPIDLLESKTNKIKFQKGKEDHFFVEAFSVGHLEKIRIGHDRPELPYAWFLDQITIYDLQQKWTYEFPCAQWFSGQGGDRKTYRDLVLGHYCATSEDNNVPVDPLIQLLSETGKIAEKTPDTNNASDSNYITALYDKLYLRESADEESTEESSESNGSSTSEEYDSEKKVISVQNFVTVETQTANVKDEPHMTSDISQPTSYTSKTSKSKSKHETAMSSSSRQSSIDTSTED